MYHQNPDSKIHEANMGSTWDLSAPDGPHVDPMNLAIRDIALKSSNGWTDGEHSIVTFFFLSKGWGTNTSSGCRVPASARFRQPLLCAWACPCSPDEQMTTILHMCRSRQFQSTWSGVNRPSGYWVMVSAKFRPNGHMNSHMNGWSIP